MRRIKNNHRLKFVILVFGLGLVICGVGGLWSPVGASSGPVPVQNPVLAQNISPDNTACLTCHSQPGLTKTLPSGEILSLTIDSSHFSESAHKDIACTDCHTDISSFPHPNLKAQTIRDFSLQMYPICQKCHQDQFNKTLDSVHMKAVEAGNTN